jgi:hypothetical protein
VARSAFDGVRVLEYATMVSGPYCSKLLADMGADVIKVEEPPQGDPARKRGPFPEDRPHPERSGLFMYLNTSKRGITLDPDEDAGRDALERLVRWADILVDNRPGRLQSLGLGWDAVQSMNPSLILTSITPYGLTGPRSGHKGSELTSYHAGGHGRQRTHLLPRRRTRQSPTHAVGGRQPGAGQGRRLPDRLPHGADGGARDGCRSRRKKGGWQWEAHRYLGAGGDPRAGPNRPCQHAASSSRLESRPRTAAEYGPDALQGRLRHCGGL